MKRPHTMSKRLILMALVMLTVGGVSGAQTVLPLQVTPVSLATTKDATQVGYLIVELPVIEVPQDMRFGEAFIELYLNVSTTRTTDSPTSDLVTLEVYPYRGTTNGKLDVSRLGPSSMKRTVRVGSNRSVRISVTEFVASTIGDRNVDRRLIIGAISSKRTGRFDAQPLPDNAQAKAALTVYLSRIEDTSSAQTRAN